MYDSYDRKYLSTFIPKIKYEKKFKNVNITIKGRLYGEGVYHDLAESPLQFINLDNIKIDSNLDSFTIDHFTIEELREFKNLITSMRPTVDVYNKEYNDEYTKLLTNEEIEPIKNELKEKTKEEFKKKN